MEREGKGITPKVKVSIINTGYSCAASCSESGSSPRRSCSYAFGGPKDGRRHYVFDLYVRMYVRAYWRAGAGIPRPIFCRIL